MSFLPYLKEAVGRVEGAVSAVIIGMDGMPVEEYTTEQLFNVDELGAEASQMLKNAGYAEESLNLGPTNEFIMVTERCSIIMRKITEEYFIIMLVTPGGNFGKGRYVLRTTVPRLEGEF